MKKLGKFGIVCLATIAMVLVVSFYVDAKHKKFKRNNSNVEWVDNNASEFYGASHSQNYSKKHKNRHSRNNRHSREDNHSRADNYSYGDNHSKDNNRSQGSSNSVNTRSESSGLTEVKVNSSYRNMTKKYTAMTVNYNTSYRVPNCVSYVLTSDMIDITNGPNAEMRRNYKFYADPSVSGCPEWYEYKGSGYDRGHMAPANDMRWSRPRAAGRAIRAVRGSEGRGRSWRARRAPRRSLRGHSPPKRRAGRSARRSRACRRSKGCRPRRGASSAVL